MSRLWLPFIILTVWLPRNAVAQCPDGTPPPCNARPGRSAAPAANSVAVLYFENLGRDTADAYIAEGLTEEVTARLGQVQRLAVTSRTAVRRLRRADEMPTAELGRALNANYLVNGSVRRAGTQVRVTVELVRASSGARVWGNQFDRSTADLLAIQEDIAIQVATGIAGRLAPSERASIAARPTRDPVAYDHFLRGQRAVRNVSPQSLAPAIREFEAALARDPAFTQARASIAATYALAINWGWATPGVSNESLLARGHAAMERALRDDPASASAWMARGVLLMFERPRTFEGALEALQRCAAMEADNANCWQWLSVVQRRLGDYDGAVRSMERATALDPDQVQAVSDRGFVAFQARRYAEAVRWYDSALVLDTLAWQNVAYRGRTLFELGDTALAIAEMRRAMTMSGGQRTAQLALAQILGRAGQPGEARALMAPHLAAYAGADSVPVRDGYELALALIGVGDRDAALGLLERIRPRGPWLYSYFLFPSFDPVRADPRFQRLASESAPPNPRPPN